MLIEQLKNHTKFSIFGAQVVAYGAYTAIRELYGMVPESFVVSGLEENPTEVEGIPVISIDALSKDIFLIVGVTELIQKAVVPMLKEKGFDNIFVLNQHEEHLLMKEFFEKNNLFITAQENYGDDFSKDYVCYEICNDRDKTLETDHSLLSYERTLQAGAELTDKKIAEFTDDTGDNNSSKNRMYCEMTAVYWIWKNRHHDYVGIEHYRRHLLVKPEMLTPEVDVIMPLPYICYPNEKAQFRRFVSEEVFKALEKALKDLHPDEFDSYMDVIYGKYQYTYNMQVSKWEVFDDYCKWFFEITEYMEKMSDEVPEISNTRALSYVAEVLTNIYFMTHKDTLNILHVEKAIYT